MIQFSDTNQTSDGLIQFVDHKGDIVGKSYPLKELEDFVTCEGLNISYENDWIYIGHGDIMDPANWDNWEREITVSVAEYLDDQDNFVDACKQFYIARNPSEFKSFNNVQETRRVG